MQSLQLIDAPRTQEAPRAKRLPSWLKRDFPVGNEDFYTHRLLRELKLETVCENARCPNRPECYARRTATFMILGNVCTRPCGFCSVPRGTPLDVQDDEPERLAQAAQRLGLKHVVITSVTRDDLPDGGADHFRRCVDAVRLRTGAVIEVLTPDFLGDTHAFDCVLQARPDVFNHNMETVPRLYKTVRPQADYRQSLDVLRFAKQYRAEALTKSGAMVGLGESAAEIQQLLRDLRESSTDVATLGQYLQPARRNLRVAEYVTPAQFDGYRDYGLSIGFKMVFSGPLVRSSYMADMVSEEASQA